MGLRSTFPTVFTAMSIRPKARLALVEDSGDVGGLREVALKRDRLAAGLGDGGDGLVGGAARRVTSRAPRCSSSSWIDSDTVARDKLSECAAFVKLRASATRANVFMRLKRSTSTLVV